MQIYILELPKCKHCVTIKTSWPAWHGKHWLNQWHEFGAGLFAAQKKCFRNLFENNHYTLSLNLLKLNVHLIFNIRAGVAILILNVCSAAWYCKLVFINYIIYIYYRNNNHTGL